MILTAIVALLVGVWIGFTIGCVIHVGANSEGYARDLWLERAGNENSNYYDGVEPPAESE